MPQRIYGYEIEHDQGGDPNGVGDVKPEKEAAMGAKRGRVCGAGGRGRGARLTLIGRPWAAHICGEMRYPRASAVLKSYTPRKSSRLSSGVTARSPCSTRLKTMRPKSRVE